MNAYTVTVTGEKTEVAPKNGKDFSLAEMYEHIGADMVEIVMTKDRRHYIVLDENGKLKPHETNQEATRLYQYGHADYIAGKVLICPIKMIK